MEKKNNDDPLSLLSKDPLSLLQNSLVYGSKDSTYRALKPWEWVLATQVSLET